MKHRYIKQNEAVGIGQSYSRDTEDSNQESLKFSMPVISIHVLTRWLALAYYLKSTSASNTMPNLYVKSVNSM